MNINPVVPGQINKTDRKQRHLQLKMNENKTQSMQMVSKFYKKKDDISVDYSNLGPYGSVKITYDSFGNDPTKFSYSLQSNQKNFIHQNIQFVLRNSNNFNRNPVDMHKGHSKNQILSINHPWNSMILSQSRENGSINKHPQNKVTDNKSNDQRQLPLPNNKDTSGIKMCPQDAIDSYRCQLTTFEKDEIFSYSEIWFLGLNAKKIEASYELPLNNGFDDENGSYIKVVHDHIAYRYEILDTLGKGSFGQVFKALDYQSGKTVAIKIIRNKKRFHEQSQIEVKLLNYLQEKERKSDISFHIVHLLDNFMFRNHPCLVFELLGENLYDVIKRNNFRGFSLPIIQKITYALFTCLSVLRKENIIHCDLKPENILIIDGNTSQIKVIDFGSSCFNHEKMYTYIQSRFYRSPEVILGIPYTTQIDVWSLGCMLPELLTGRPIFPGETEMDQLLCIMEVFDLPPKSVMDESSRKKLFFDNKGEPKVLINNRGRKRVPNSQTIQSMMKMHTDPQFLDLITNCLRWDSKLRIQPDNALKHPWFQNYRPNEDRIFTSSMSRWNQNGVQHVHNKEKNPKLLPSINNGFKQRKEYLSPIRNGNKNRTDYSQKENTPVMELPYLFD